MLLRKQSSEQRIRIMYVFLLGFFIGMIGMSMFQNLFLSLGLLDSLMWKNLNQDSLDKLDLFLYIFGIRIKQVLWLVLGSVTPLYKMILWGTIGCFGAGLGVYFFAAMSEYGVKGILLILAVIFPQWLIYVLAFLWLFEWCQIKAIGKKQFAIHLLKLGICILVTITGVLLESYVNPEIIKIFSRIL